MADLSALSNDELAASIRDGLNEAEVRLLAAGESKLLRRVQNAHAVLGDVGASLAGSGNVSTDSVGGDKP